jgi:hypothetical protein
MFSVQGGLHAYVEGQEGKVVYIVSGRSTIPFLFLRQGEVDNSRSPSLVILFQVNVPAHQVGVYSAYVSVILSLVLFSALRFLFSLMTIVRLAFICLLRVLSVACLVENLSNLAKRVLRMQEISLSGLGVGVGPWCFARS